MLTSGLDAHIREMLHHISDAFQLIDDQWRYVYFNAAAKQLFVSQGINADAIIGKHVWREVFVGQQGELWAKELSRCVSERRVIEFENYFAPWQKWFKVRVHPVAGGGVAVFSQDVTESKDVAQALKSSQTRYQSLFNSIDAGFCICELIFDVVGKPCDYRILEINQAFEKLTRLTSDCVGKTARQLVKNFDDHTLSDFEKVVKESRSIRIEIPSQSAVGRIFDVFATPMAQKNFFALVFTDITAQKTAEASLRTMEQDSAKQRRLYEAILTNTPDLAYVWGPDHRFIYVNEGLLKMWGRTWDEAIGKNCLELGYEPWHAAMHDREIDQVMATGQPIRGEVPFEGAFGRRIYDYILVPVWGADGKVEAVAGTTRDVTERKLAEDSIRYHSQQIETILSAAPVGVFLVDSHFRIRAINPIAIPVFGGDPARIIERDFEAVIHEILEQQVADGVVSLFRNTLTTGESYSTPNQAMLRAGQSAVEHYEWRIDRITLPDGQFGLVCYFRDVSSQIVAAEEKVALLESERAARAEAERAGRMKDEFLATLSHELRTPLNAILGYATLMRMARMDAVELTDTAETIERNARAQAQMIEDLLDMNRIISGKVRLTIEQIELSTVVEEALKTVMPAADAKGVSVQRIVEPLSRPIWGDASRIQQIVWNLLSNAIKFTAKGGKVQLVVRQNASEVEVRVTDNGKGIAPEFLPHVFDRFRQADSSTTRRYGGLGLGLAIVRHLVELHGGSVSAASPGEGLGATFVVSFPIAVINHSNDLLPLDSRQIQEASYVLADTELEGIRVLVVDDEADATRLVQRMLHECRAQVEMASSAQEGLELLRQKQFHVLVSDIGMPGEDGFQFIRQVRAMTSNPNREIPALALTAFARSEDRRRAAMAGFHTHLAKPVDAGELVAVVASLVGRAGR